MNDERQFDFDSSRNIILEAIEKWNNSVLQN